MRSPQMKHHEAPKQLRWDEDGLLGICEAICWLRCQRNQRQSKFGDVQCFLWRKWFNRCSLKHGPITTVPSFGAQKALPGTVPEVNHGEASTLAELGISKNLSSQAQKLAAIPSETFEAKLAAGERRRFAFIRTKEKTIKDPLGAFRPRLAAAAKNPVAHYADAPGPTVSLDRVQMYFAYNNAYSTLIKGPARSGKLAVLRTWTPAFPSPLNGVTVPSAPAFVASTGELNHKPQW